MKLENSIPILDPRSPIDLEVLYTSNGLYLQCVVLAPNLVYCQNRLVLTDDNYSEKQILCDFAIIPELDEILFENKITI